MELYPLRRIASGEIRAQTLGVGDVSFQAEDGDRWSMSFGLTTLVFPSEVHARVAERWVEMRGRTRVPTDDLKAIRMPNTETGCQRLLAIADEQAAEVERLRERLDAGEAEVDALVAELYDLDEDALAVIEDFLARF